MQNRATVVVPLDPERNKTGHVWHLLLGVSPDTKNPIRLEDMLYAYQFDGPFSPEDGLYFDSSKLLLDPYAKVLPKYLYHLIRFHFIFNVGIMQYSFKITSTIPGCYQQR